jgi:7-cyano-7-deazaguanine synthase
MEFSYLGFNYGQRHRKELFYAMRTARDLDGSWDHVDLKILRNLLGASGSSLVSATAVPDGHYAEESMKATVVPNRNAIMLSIATGVAVARGAEFVAAGMHAGDHFIYPDCRPPFINAFSSAMRLGNEGFAHNDFRVWAPFIKMTKAEIVKVGAQLNVPFEQTWSCYKGNEHHCGTCGTCNERIEAFELAGVADPTQYEGSPVL